MASYRKKGRIHYYRYRDADGNSVERAGCSNLSATKQIAEKAEADAAKAKAGVTNTRDDRYAREGRRPLAEHLADFAKYLADKGGNANHARVKANRAARLFELAEANTLGSVTVATVQGALAKLEKEGLSIQTRNHYLDAAKMFCTWCIQDGRASESPIRFMSRKSPLSDLRRTRRNLTAEECRMLVESLARGQDILDVTPADRVALYLVAIGTGFRAAEIRSLTPERFNLEGPMPSIIVKAGYTKNRKEAIQPINPALARVLAPWLATKEPGKPVFRMRLNDFAPTLRSDLKLAGIPVKTEDGLIDFHALRGTFVGLLVRSGASVKETQTLARHSTPTLTFGVYAKVKGEDVADAIGRLPDLSSPRSETNGEE